MTVILKLKQVSELCGGLGKHRFLGPRVFDSVVLWREPRIYISNKFPGDTDPDAADQGPRPCTVGSSIIP